jgi:hypothetical protein
VASFIAVRLVIGKHHRGDRPSPGRRTQPISDTFMRMDPLPTCACQPPSRQELRTTTCRVRCEIAGGDLTPCTSREPHAFGGSCDRAPYVVRSPAVS